MSNELHPGSGLANGRQWSALPSNGGPIEWSVDPTQGHVQGPLALEFLRGQKLSLILEEGQQALLIKNGHLKAVYLDGAHYLEIGQQERQIHPECQLIFLTLNEPLQLNWTRANPLRWGQDPHQTLIGSCALRVEWPSRFFGTFLLGQNNPDPKFINRLIDQIVRGVFEEILSADPDTGDSPSEYEVQARLTRLSAADLEDELNPCGLHCTHLAVYTSTPPIEAEQDTTAQLPSNVTSIY